VITAGTTGLIAATAAGPSRGTARGRQPPGDGAPEQIHLTWGDNPARAVVVSWASAGRADRPRVRIGQRVITPTERACSDPRSGVVTWTYHARVDGLRPGATYGYAVTADNDASAADPFSATFTTAPEGRAAFRFTSFGDLGTSPGWPGAALESGQAAYAAGAVETFQPLFHLDNGDLTAASPAPGALAQAWRDFGNNVQASAANRPWLPVPGNHALELGDGEQGLASFLARYTLPANGMAGLEGRWYAFRVGTALFVCLSGDDVAYQDAAAPGAGTGPSQPRPTDSLPVGSLPGGSLPAGSLPAGNLPAGRPAEAAGTVGSGRGYSGGAQSRWLEATLAAARGDASLDWIVVQLHQCACSSATAGAGSDLGIRREWLPLFDTYEVDLVLSGHDHGYERSFPVRGPDAGAVLDAMSGAAADTRRPHPVTTVDSGVFDTSQGTVHLVLGCAGPGAGPGGTAAAAGTGGTSGLGEHADDAPRLARVLTWPAGQMRDGRLPPDGATGPDGAVEAATWSARRDASPGYGIAVFDVDPGSEAGGQTSITVRYYHDFHQHRAAGPDPVSPVAGEPDGDYAFFETFTLVRPRSDGRRWHLRE
jgi:Purple acid Phosphatase, N-terminal domain/Calcineurin-like phosphoesterase